MNKIDKTLLQLIKNILSNETDYNCLELTQEQWIELMNLAHTQEILPLICDKLYSCPSFRSIDKHIKDKYKRIALEIATREIIQTNEFLTLIKNAQSIGLNPIVIKGIVCRSLYPLPYLRPSVDEDLLISLENIDKYHKFLLDEGLFCDEIDVDIVDIKEKEELSYHKEYSPTYIELHTALFSKKSRAYGDLNSLFPDYKKNSISFQIEDVVLRTLSYTDHLLYLICHAYKHFLHGGFGIRQIMDISLFTNAYKNNVDWEKIYNSCKSESIDIFASAIFKIGYCYLNLEEIPNLFNNILIDETPLLDDVLSDGIYGNNNVNRTHSGNITLEAIISKKEGRKSFGLIHSLFPGTIYLKTNYHYAKKHPILIPVAWAHRILKYILTRKKYEVDPIESIKIANSRIELLKTYKII